MSDKRPVGKFYAEVINRLIANMSAFACKNAFCINGVYYTYRELGEKIAGIQERLQDVEEERLGLVINDDLSTYASIIALWLEGKCYVPLHPEWPLTRCLDVCEQINVKCVLDSSDRSRYTTYRILETKDADAETFPCSKENVEDDALAYILFTSSTTGKPKGVPISRRNLASFMESFWLTGIEIDANDRCLQCFDLSFDVSIPGFLAPLLSGACVYTVPVGRIKYIFAGGLIEDYKLTFATVSPSMLRCMRPYFGELDASSLKTCLLVAEASELSLIEDWWKCASNNEIYNFYGPTECTIYCTYYRLSKGEQNKQLNGLVSIGRPMTGCVGIVCDEQGNELKPKEKGELCIAGEQVTGGYWNNEEKNAQVFFCREGIRYYRTGDICYKDEEGDIMYSGRMDSQAKIQGFRVELGEIECHAKEFLKDKNVVCMAFDNEKGLTEIAAFVESEDFDNKELVTYLKGKMPSYMIPTKWIFVPVFPLNQNEKIDKPKLKEILLEKK